MDENQATTQRLDIYVSSLLPEISRSTAVKLIVSGKIKINGQVIEKASYKVKPSDKVVVDFDPQQLNDYPSIDIPVLYEDDDCVVIDKPLGVLTHSKGAFNPEATVATWLQDKVQDLSGERAGIVHRLDRATSGVMICAKTPEALSWLQKQFAQRRTKKTYAAVVNGRPKADEALIDMPIERNPTRPQTFRVGVNGKPSTTKYSVIGSNQTYSLLELKPETGRTHQLRVHLSHLGHPILGDTLYGGPQADRLYLHAESLEITLPNRSRQVFSSNMPAEFKEKIS